MSDRDPISQQIAGGVRHGMIALRDAILESLRGAPAARGVGEIVSAIEKGLESAPVEGTEEK